ncbi:MAG: ATP-binding protein, partial [Lachnospiraceae bacterium]|nr:ATP-binding protein [Lachnospiraceae bacterium]
MSARTEEYLRSVVRELVKLPAEVEWVEFKCSNKDPERIAKYISGLSNSATLCERPNAYIIWGVADDTHKIVGTDFEYRKMRKGNEELEAWLVRMINPKINFNFYDVLMENGKKVTLLEIPCAEREPVKYGSLAMIRIGSNLKPLAGYSEKEQELWKRFDTTIFELRTAKLNVSEDDVVRLLDFSRYYDAMQLPVPRNRESIMDDFCHEKFLKRNENCKCKLNTSAKSFNR